MQTKRLQMASAHNIFFQRIDDIYGYGYAFQPLISDN